jgi:hypothetical protein
MGDECPKVGKVKRKLLRGTQDELTVVTLVSEKTLVTIWYRI